LSFCFASEGSRRIVYVGGIQGVRQTNILDRYRSFTRSASGMRPRDFLIEVFRTFCRVLNVTEIRAVSSANHITNSQGFTEATEINDDIKLSYDEVWKARGGVYDGKSFFVLATDVRRRPIQELPAKKRPIYRKRYLMLDQVDAQLVHVMRSRCNLAHSVGLKTEWTDASGCLPKLADAK
jgi:uncharacterized protein VirK/YbjX